MKIWNRHERIVVASPERIAPLIADFDRVWPTELAPAPQRRGPRLYVAGLMWWEEFDRPGATRAFRVVKPDEMRGEHWFELSSADFELSHADGATMVRHTVEACAAGKYEAIWRDQIEPRHDQILEGLFDNLEAAITRSGPAPAQG